MALDDSAIVVAAKGYVYVHNTLGFTAPTPSQITNFNPDSFGAQTSLLKITGSPTGGTYTVTVASQTTSALAYNASNSTVQAAIEALSSVGAGNTTVTGVSTSDTGGLTISYVGTLLGGATLTTSATGSFTGGTTPAVTSVSTAGNGWANVGHTSRTKLPEFGYDGGKLEMKGSWQKQRLRQVWGAQPIEDMVKLNLEQWSRETAELYFGADTANTDGVWGVSGDWEPVEKAFLVVLVDQDVNLACYASKASIARDAAIAIPLDDFSSLPIAATFLNLGARRLYDWISEDLFPLP
jgi:hypothetical protein